MNDVSILVIDFKDHELTRRSIEKTLTQFSPKDIIVISDRDFFPGSKFVEAHPTNGWYEYNYLLHNCANYINTSHVLYMHWDSWAVNKNLWTNEFLKYDYIGSPWYFMPPEQAVGGGGFSLRSRKLIETLANDEFISNIDPSQKNPEDSFICITIKTYLSEFKKIKFAPLAVAENFSFETLAPKKETFGFHGAYGLVKYSNYDEFVYYITTKMKFDDSATRIFTGDFWRFAILAIYELQKVDFLPFARFSVSRLNDENFSKLKYNLELNRQLYDFFFN